MGSNFFEQACTTVWNRNPLPSKYIILFNSESFSSVLFTFQYNLKLAQEREDPYC